MLAIVLAVGVGGYALYQRPEIRELFQTSEPKRAPLDFLENLPKVSPKPPAPKPPPRSQSREQDSTASSKAGAAETPPAAQSVRNQVPNDEVAHVLLGILAAKKLGRYLSLTVTDDEIVVYGEVASDAEKRQIRDILDKGRETRRINLEHLTVRGTEAGS